MRDENPTESRMSRWSRRKLDRAKESVEEDATEVVGSGAAAPPSEEELAAQEAEIAQLQANREAAEAVDLETADKDTDYTVFMKSGVPAALKRKAFSVLWRSDPILANLDELLDYGENFADPKLNMEVFKSAWQIGKGYMEKAEAEPSETEIEDENDEGAEENEEAIANTGSTEQVEDQDEDQDLETTAVEESAVTDIAQLPDIAEVSDPENQIAEAEEIQPKVSLRRRLMLDA